MHRGTLILILVPLLVGFIALMLISSTYSTLTSGSFSLTLDTIGALVAVVIIGAILGIIGLLDIREGFKTLRDLGRDVGIGYTGATLYFVALIILVLGVLVMIASPIGGLGLLLLGGIIELVSNILIGVGFYKVGVIYNESLTKIGGILAAIPIGIISFVGYIIAYVGLGKIRPMSAIQPQMPLSQPGYPPQIYQVRQGIIRGDGTVKITLYSATQATVLSARIEGTTLASANINPTVLQPGQNEINIKFDNVSLLTPGGSYILAIVVNVGENISEIKANAIYQP